MKASYLHYRVSDILSQCLPLEWAHRLGELVSRSAYLSSKGEHEAIKKNLAVVLGSAASEDHIDEKVGEVYRNFGRYFVDLLYSRRFSQNEFLKRIEFVNLGALHTALSRGRGAIVLSAHLGNWEFGAMALATQVPFWAVVNEHKDPRINQLFVERRNSLGVKMLPIGTAIRKCLRVLQKNECIGINGDRRYAEKGREVLFFGQPACLPRGPVFLSMKSGSPIVGCYLMPSENGKQYRLVLYDPIYPDHEDEEHFWQRTCRLLEDMVRKHPTHWLTFEEVWRHPE